MVDKYALAVEILELHFEEHQAVSSDQHSLLQDLFPEFLMTQNAYRAIICKPLQNVAEVFLQDAQKSWSASLEGIKQFINNEFIDGVCEESDIIKIYEAEVLGINLAKLVTELVRLEKMSKFQATKFLEEEEIVSLVVQQVKLFKVLSVNEILFQVI